MHAPGSAISSDGLRCRPAGGSALGADFLTTGGSLISHSESSPFEPPLDNFMTAPFFQPSFSFTLGQWGHLVDLDLVDLDRT